MNLRRIFHTTLKELKQMSRDRKLYPLLFVAPTLQIVILGYAATFDIHNIPTAVLDRDNSAMSRAYLRSFHHNGHFTIRHHVSERAELYNLLERGHIKIAIEIPVHFQRKLKKGAPSPVQFIVDGTASNSATIALNYARIISEKFSSRLIMERVDLPAFNAGDFLGSFRREIGNTFLVDSQTRLWYNPNLQSADFMVPGVICMLLLIVTTNLTALSIVKEKEIVFIDVRKSKEQQVSMLPGAITDITYLKDPDKFKDDIKIAYCTIAYRSGKFAQKLRKKGITIINLRGGILAWVHAGGKVYDEHGQTNRIHVYGRQWDLVPEGYEAIW